LFAASLFALFFPFEPLRFADAVEHASQVPDDALHMPSKYPNALKPTQQHIASK
jgi:hypothetical protein